MIQEMIYLRREEIVRLGGGQSDLYLEAIEEALVLHAEQRFVQPLKPYLRTQGKDGHIADRIIAMPAYVGGDMNISGIKWVGSKHDNPAVRGLERASALIVLNDPESNYPVAVMEAGLISSMRTAAVTAVAAKHLAKPSFHRIACIGCGLIAERQLQTMLEQFGGIDEITLYDANPEAAQRMAGQLQRWSRTPLTIRTMDTAEEAVQSGEVVITCTVTDQPYLPYHWLQKGAFVSNVSIMDLEKDVFLKADKVVVDDWDQANREKKVLHQLVTEGSFSRERLYAELGEIVSRKKAGRENNEEIIVLNPMGMAIEDIACAYKLYTKAIAVEAGIPLPLY